MEKAKLAASLTDAEAAELEHVWEFWARPTQMLPAGAWTTWVILAGRGFGKTRTGAEATRWAVERGGYRRLTLAGPTAADVRDVMVEGESGLMAVSHPRPVYEPSKSRITWPNGAIAALRSADEPDRFRGLQSDWVWADELAAWRYPDAWAQIQLGHRLGDNPRAIVTTTPRPTQIIRELVASSSSVVTRGSTYDNRANLAQKFIETIVARYEGTRLGRQEVYAEILTDTPGALWTRSMLDAAGAKSPPRMRRIVVALDPAVTSDEKSDETGIVVAGIDDAGLAWVLEDASGVYTPTEWAAKAARLYSDYQADRVIAEVNNGGDLVETVLRTVAPNVAYRGVRASKGKRSRAEPVAALYEQGRVRHVGNLAKLEDQLCTWSATTGEDSPDRLDALVWALTELVLDSVEAEFQVLRVRRAR